MENCCVWVRCILALLPKYTPTLSRDQLPKQSNTCVYTHLKWSIYKTCICIAVHIRMTPPPPAAGQRCPSASRYLVSIVPRVKLNTGCPPAFESWTTATSSPPPAGTETVQLTVDHKNVNNLMSWVLDFMDWYQNWCSCYIRGFLKLFQGIHRENVTKNPQSNSQTWDITVMLYVLLNDAVAITYKPTLQFTSV